MTNQIQTIHTTDPLDSFIIQLRKAQEIVAFVKNSDFGKKFQKRVTDPNNPDKEILEISEDDIIANISLGAALGIDPISSLALGKNLDKLAYFKVMKGKLLGLSPAASLLEMYAYEDRDGKISIGTSVAAKIKSLLDANISYEYVIDFQPKIYYRIAIIEGSAIKSGQFIGWDYDDIDYFVIGTEFKINSSLLEEGLKSKKILIIKHTTYYSKVEFSKPNFPKHYEDYSLLDASDAGLFKGLKKDGTYIEGKANWNNHPKTILNGRILSIASSKLTSYGTLYTIDEVTEIKSNDIGVDVTISE